MKFRSAVGLLCIVTTVTFLVVNAVAQTPAPAGRAQGPAPAVRGRGAAAAARPVANLLQLMRAIPFPNSNIIFFVQSEDPTKVKPLPQASTAINPLESPYGGWQAVENAALALADFANLLMVPGRRCANGRPIPLQNPDWPKFVQGLRDAGMAAYKAAQSKSQDAIVEAADVMTTACSNCHEKWRDVEGGPKNRCQ